jgi:DNA-binding response OmpR family regulator
MRLLLIESDTIEQSESLLAHLQTQGHTVGQSDSPLEAAQHVVTYWPACIVINALAGDLHPVSFRDHLVETNFNVPVLVVGHNVDIEDAFATTISTEELDQQISEITTRQEKRFLYARGLVVDRQERQVLRAGKGYALTPKELGLLMLLLENPNKVISRKIIMQRVWDTDFMGDTRTLDVHIRWLREKIEENPSRPELLQTVRGVGYRFVDENQDT